MRFKRYKTWVVVADGAKARILLNEGPGKGLIEIHSLEEAEARKPTRDQGTDRPGRERSIGSNSRHAFEPPADWHEQAKTQFVHELAERINRAEGNHAFDRIVLAAPPKMLAVLRDRIAPQVRDRVLHEYAKDLTNIPTHELPGYFGDVLRC